MSEPKPLTRIDFKTGRFIANGTEYYISEYVTVGREIRYLRSTSKIAYGYDWKGIFQVLNKIYTIGTTGNDSLKALHEINVLAMNTMDGIKSVANDERVPDIYELCALIINRIDEDPSTITDAQIRQKFNDWQKEAIPREDFFDLAIASMTHSSSALKVLREAIARAEKELQETNTTSTN